jgi:hypothetical protein
MRKIIAFRDYYKTFMETLTEGERTKVPPKTPREEIKKAIRLKKEYYAEKE